MPRPYPAARSVVFRFPRPCLARARSCLAPRIVGPPSVGAPHTEPAIDHRDTFIPASRTPHAAPLHRLIHTGTLGHSMGQASV